MNTSSLLSLQTAAMKDSVIKTQNGSFPVESDGDLDVDSQEKSFKSRRFCVGRESSAYQELREIRLPSVHTLKRNAKISMKKLRCQSKFRSGLRGIVTYDDYTADLYGCDVDDELPLLEGSDADELTK